MVTTRLSTTPATSAPGVSAASCTRCVTSVSLRSPSPMGASRASSAPQNSWCVDITCATRGVSKARSAPRASTPSKVSEPARCALRDTNPRSRATQMASQKRARAARWLHSVLALNPSACSMSVVKRSSVMPSTRSSEHTSSLGLRCASRRACSSRLASVMACGSSKTTTTCAAASWAARIWPPSTCTYPPKVSTDKGRPLIITLPSSTASAASRGSRVTSRISLSVFICAKAWPNFCWKMALAPLGPPLSPMPPGATNADSVTPRYIATRALEWRGGLANCVLGLKGQTPSACGTGPPPAKLSVARFCAPALCTRATSSPLWSGR